MDNQKYEYRLINLSKKSNYNKSIQGDYKDIKGNYIDIDIINNSHNNRKYFSDEILLNMFHLARCWREHQRTKEK